MTNSLIPLTEVTLSLGLAYLLHSTLLLIGVAIALRGIRSASHTLRERLWKLAVVVPLVTSPLQVWVGVAPIPDGWSLSVGSAGGTSNVQLSTSNVESSVADSGRVTVASEVESASGVAVESATRTESVLSPLGGEGALSAGEGGVENGIGSAMVASLAPSFGLRPSSPLRGEGTEMPPGAKVEISESPAASAIPGAAHDADLTATTDSPIAELAPADSLPESASTGDPPTTQPDWRLTEPPKDSRSEMATVSEPTLIENSAAIASAVAPPAVAPTTASSNSMEAIQRQPAVRIEPVAFGIALAILASLAGAFFY